MESRILDWHCGYTDGMYDREPFILGCDGCNGVSFEKFVKKVTRAKKANLVANFRKENYTCAICKRGKLRKSPSVAGQLYRENQFRSNRANSRPTKYCVLYLMWCVRKGR